MGRKTFGLLETDQQRFFGYLKKNTIIEEFNKIISRRIKAERVGRRGVKKSV